MTGAGGTGKPAVVHALRRQFKRLGLGRVLVTAYTGVAAAPFGGPTILKLLNMSVKGKSSQIVKIGNAEDQQKMLKKFQVECDAPIEEFLATLTEVSRYYSEPHKWITVFAVECHYYFAVTTTKSRLPEAHLGISTSCRLQPRRLRIRWHASFAKQRGFKLLTSARRVELKRLMRARDDQAFIDHQLQMRQTGLRQPISDQFLAQSRTVTDADLEADATWRFAPVGVLAHVKRDFINLQQL